MDDDNDDTLLEEDATILQDIFSNEELDNISQEDIDFLYDALHQNEQFEEEPIVAESAKDKKARKLAQVKAYQKTQAYKDAVKKYHQTQKYKDYRKKYTERPESKEKMKILQATPQYRAVRNKYFRSPECKARKKENYKIKKQRIQKIIQDLASKYNIDIPKITYIVNNKTDTGLTEPEIEIRNEYKTEYQKFLKRQNLKNIREESSQHLNCETDNNIDMTYEGGKQKSVKKNKKYLGKKYKRKTARKMYN